MGLLSSVFSPRAAAFGPTQQVGDQHGWFVKMLGGGKTHAGVAVSHHTARQLPVVYACVNRISNPVADFPLTIFRVKKGGGSEEVTDHPMSMTLGLRPNPFMSSRTVRKTAQSHALLQGNGYLEIERNGRGQAVGLWPLMPDSTAPYVRDQELYYRTSIAGTSYELPSDDVVHIMDQSQDGYTGLSAIALNRQALGMAVAMEEFGAKFFANDAKSGGFLMHPGKLSATAQTNLKGPIEERTDPGAGLQRQGGLENAHRVKVLEEGMKWISTTIPPEDAQFLGSRAFQIAEIARIFDVPLILLQSTENTTAWGSGIEQLMLGFVRQTIAPWIGAWEQELNWKLFTDEERAQGYYVKFNMNALLRGDMAARSAFYKSLFEVGGISPNTVLALEDMDGIGPAGDFHFVPANYVTIQRAIADPNTTVRINEDTGTPPEAQP